MQSDRLEKLINNLLDVSRADARTPVLQRESFDMSELVADATERFAEEFARVGCQVTVDAREPKQVVEAHSGSVTLVSRPRAGATFTLMLPCD